MTTDQEIILHFFKELDRLYRLGYIRESIDFEIKEQKEIAYNKRRNGIKYLAFFPVEPLLFLRMKDLRRFPGLEINSILKALRKQSYCFYDIQHTFTADVAGFASSHTSYCHVFKYNDLPFKPFQP